MYDSVRRVRATFLGLMVICAPVSAQPGRGQSPDPPATSIVVPGEIALGSLMALSDGYLQKFADALSLFAMTDEARSADWQLIRTPLAALAARNVDALVWFALPEGNYWSVQQGASGNLADRAYFSRVLAGETVIGALVVSRSTGRASAIVAVPITDVGGVIVGVLGASVYLDQLSARVDNEMAIGEGMIFYSFDATPLLALEWDPHLILVDPLSLDPDIRAVFEYMMSRRRGYRTLPLGEPMAHRDVSALAGHGLVVRLWCDWRWRARPPVNTPWPESARPAADTNVEGHRGGLLITMDRAFVDDVVNCAALDAATSSRF